MFKQVRVGLGVIIVREGKMLVGKRKGSHAEGLYAFPGGHLEFGETWEQCMLREVAEECGDDLIVEMQDTHFVTNDIMPQYGKHYITIFVVAKWIEGEEVNKEPNKCEGWDWVTLEQLETIDAADWIPLEMIKNRRELIGV